MKQGEFEKIWDTYVAAVLVNLDLSPEELEDHKKTFYSSAVFSLALASIYITNNNRDGYAALQAELKVFAGPVLDDLMAAMKTILN